MIEHATVTAPEMIGLLVWWIVVLAAPVIAVCVGAGGAEPRAHGAGEANARRRWQGHMPQPSVDPVGRRPIGRATARLVGGASRASDRGPVALDRRAATARAPAASVRTARMLRIRQCRVCGLERSSHCAGTSTSSVGSSSRHRSSGRRLSQLPAGRWRVEPYPLTGERRNTLLVLGETGVFVISATYPPGDWDDVVTVSRLAAKIQTLLPGYCGRVHSAICHPFSRVTPRVWHRADDHGEWIGAWLIGGDSVIEWLRALRDRAWPRAG